MRISDWSSDVCSSDLLARRRPARRGPGKAGAGPGGTVMQGSPLSSVILFHLGPVAISRPVLTTRSEQRRVGQECVRTCRSLWPPAHLTKKQYYSLSCTPSTNQCLTEYPPSTTR